MRAGNYLGVMCLFFGAALAAFVSGSLEPRLGNLFVFGVILIIATNSWNKRLTCFSIGMPSIPSEPQ